jgi:hypothetical protein
MCAQNRCSNLLLQEPEVLKGVDNILRQDGRLLRRDGSAAGKEATWEQKDRLGYRAPRANGHTLLMSMIDKFGPWNSESTLRTSAAQ